MKEAKDCFVVIVSDDLNWLNDLGFLLQKHRFKTLSVETPEQVVIFNKLTRPDLIVTNNARQAVILKRHDIKSLYVQNLDVQDARQRVIAELFPALPGRKRVHDRIDVEIDAFVEPSELAGHFLEGKIRNISRRGVFVSPNGLLPRLGSLVTVEFTCPVSPPFTFEALAIVRWIRSNDAPEGFGAQFVSLTDVAREYLENLVGPKREGPPISDGPLKITS